MSDSKRVILQSRDYKLLHFLYDMEFCSIKAIQTYVFCNLNAKSTVKGRIAILKNAGYIGAFKTDNYYVYYLKPKAIGLLKIKYPNEQFSNKSRQLSLSNIDHTVIISELRAIIENKENVTNYVSEKKLRTLEKNQTSYVPDGIIHLEDEILVFEYERTLKSNHRIDQRINELRDVFATLKSNSNKKISALIVCESETIKKKYQNTLYAAAFRIVLTKDIIN
jgi:hypothetical protein